MSVSLTFTIGGSQAEALKEKIRAEAMSRGMSMSEFITEAVAEALRKEHAAQG